MMDDEPLALRRSRLRAQFAPHRERLAKQLRAPWYAAEDEDYHFEDELAVEVHPDHPLWGETCLLIARRQDQDDFAFLLPDGRVATTHLTFRGAREHGPWPCTGISATLDAWLREVAKPESLDWGSH